MFKIIKDFRDFLEFKKMRNLDTKRLRDLYVDKWICVGYVWCMSVRTYTYGSVFQSDKQIKLTIEVNPLLNEIKCTNYDSSYASEGIEYSIKRAYHNFASEVERRIIDDNLKKYGMII